jgi:hypothetical protein
MKFPCYFTSLQLAFAVTVGWQIAAAENAAPKYKFSEGATNAYRITIESPSQNMPMRMEGYMVVGVRAVDEEVATVFFRGRVQPKQVEGGRPRMAGPFMGPGPFGGPGQFGPRFEPWRFMNLTPFNEAQVDASGRILRIAGLQELPKPLETYAEIFFHQLPADLAKPYQSEQIVTLDEEPSGRGRMPGGYYPGGPGGGPARLTGVRKESIQVGEKSGSAIKLQKNVEFRSHLKTDDQPRLSYSTKSELVFDPAAGVLKSAKIEGVANTATLEVLQKSTFTVRIEQLAGADLAKAIAENAERPATISDAELDSLLAELQGDDPQKRSEAAQRLLAADLDKHASRLLPIVMPFLNNNDQMLSMVAGRVLARAATREHLPLLHRMLKQEDRGNQHEVIQALGRIKDKSSIQPLADMIAYGTGNAYAAAEALGEFGSLAEEAGLALLKEKHLETRRQACQILRKAGTSKSIEALQAVIAAGDPQLIQEASETVRSIRQRDEETSKLVF